MKILKIISLLTFILILLSAQKTWAKDLESICGPYYLKDSHFLESTPFSSNDKKVICGSDTPGWEKVPLNQALHQIGVILENDGYYNWKHYQEGNKIIIDKGSLVKISKIEYVNAPDNFFDVTYIGVIGKYLDSSILDEVKSWTIQRMQAIGYPCPQATVKASFKTQKVIVTIERGPYSYIKKIDRENLEKLNSQALSRYDVIQEGDQYNRDFLNLTLRRMYADRIVSYAYFETKCENETKTAQQIEKEAIKSFRNQEATPTELKQNIILDKPNSVIFAVGASSEELPLFKARYQRSRLDDNASTLSSELYLSSVIQSLATDVRLYLFDDFPRFYLNPNFEIKRQNEIAYESLFQKYQMAMVHSYDSSNFQINTKFAPTYNFEKNFESEERDNIQYLSFDTSLSLTDHYYEYYRLSPRTGYQLNLNWSSQKKGVGSDFSGNQYKISGKVLSNIGFFDPPILVLGARFEIATVDVESLDFTPQRMRLYLGGNQDMRGFARKSINNYNKGFLTTAYMGFESRFVSLLPYKLQPYLLFDMAKVGQRSFSLSQALLYSPGIGLRWESPIGNFRTSLAKGYIKDKDSSITNEQEELTLFFSYGQEF